ncbi:MAG: hypothetical protein BWY64_02707 [bacterium ADurb.Bin363]|nr:MAG: hypothetical protein BWY64_02707 [bacterium ADurb.Bin363]
MENLVKAMGAEAVDWAFKTECCGASFAISNAEAMMRLTGRVIGDAILNDCDCIMVACPLCHANLDMRQQQINDAYGTNFNIPIFYFTELLGIACGIPLEELKIGCHLTDPFTILKAKQLC